MALFINDSERPYHIPFKELRERYPDDIAAYTVDMLSLDMDELDVAYKLYPQYCPDMRAYKGSCVTLYGDIAKQVLSSLLWHHAHG